MAVPVDFYAEISSRGTPNQVVRQEFNALDRDPDPAVGKGVRDCLAYLLSCAKQPTFVPMLQPLTSTTMLYHYIDGISARTVVFFAVGGDQTGAMTRIVAVKFAQTYNAHAHTTDIQAALARFQSHPGTWL